MNIIKFITLELKTVKEGPLYTITNKAKAGDLILLLNYLFFEYTRKDLELIMQNLEIIDEEMDDEIVVHGKNKSLSLDLANPTMLYISQLTDYLKYEDSPAADAIDATYADHLKKKKLEHFRIDRESFLKLLRDWHVIIEKKPSNLILCQDKFGKIGFQSFATKQAMQLYENQYCPR